MADAAQVSIPANLALTDPVGVAQALIRLPSVSPDPGASQYLLAAMLERLGFEVIHLPFGEGAERTPNFFARLGTGSPHICYAGHTDVVPPGNEADWSHPLMRRILWMACCMAVARVT